MKYHREMDIVLVKNCAMNISADNEHTLAGAGAEVGPSILSTDLVSWRVEGIVVVSPTSFTPLPESLTGVVDFCKEIECIIKILEEISYSLCF